MSDRVMGGTTTPLSLNEIGFYFTRAAVGAGAPFGIGGEFAEACKHLAYLGFDPAQAAVPALHGLECGQSSASLVRRAAGDMIHVGGGDTPLLSALYAGPVAADRLSIEAACGMERRLRLDDTDQPLLVVGAVSAAGIAAARIALSWRAPGGGRAVVALYRGVATVTGLGSDDIGAPAPAQVDIVLNADAPPIPHAHAATRSLAEGRARAVREGVGVDAAARSAVLAFFDKCLVPATDRSRDAGAGAGGLTDND